MLSEIDQFVDYGVKITFVGDECVGKSSIIKRFLKNTFDETYVQTNGVKYLSKTVARGAKCYKLHIWDTSGAELYRNIIQGYCDAQNFAIVFVYDVSNKKSFEDLRCRIDKLCIDDDVLKIFVGNKIDIESREVSSRNGLEFARKHNAIFTEASAKQDRDVKLIFDLVVLKFMEKIQNKVS